jgi:hypothetical protein
LRHKEEYFLDVWNKGVFYQFVHSFGMIVASIAPNASSRDVAGIILLTNFINNLS